MKLLIIDNADYGDEHFSQPLLQAVAQFAEIDSINYLESAQIDSGEYDGIILSGVPKHYAFETSESRLKALDWIKHVNVPVLGICLGHQVLGRMYGAEIIRDREAELGMQTLQLQQYDPILEGMDEQPGNQVMAMHRGSITLPEEFELLARTDLCRNQLMKHKTRDIYGAQFHPELSPGAVSLLHNFASIAAAKASAEAPAEAPAATTAPVMAAA